MTLEALRGWAPDWPPDRTGTPPDFVVGGAGCDSLQTAIDRAVSAGGAARHIALEPGFHAGPAYIPPEAPALRITGPGKDQCTLAAGVDAQMPGLEFRTRFGAQFEQATPPVRAHVARLIARQRLTTQNACVLRVGRDDVQLSGFTIRNDYACDRPDAAPKGAEPDLHGRYGEGQHQAVALHVAGADRVALHDMRLSSFQDTLYLQSGPGANRIALARCEIEGDVDFIFGGAVGIFSECEIRSLGSRCATSWAAAPSTNIHQPFGFVFDHCRFTSDGAPMTAFIARQWFEGVRASPFGAPSEKGFQTRLGPVNRLAGSDGEITRQTLESVGKCHLIRCQIGAHIAAPWDSWNSPGTAPRYRPALSDAKAFHRALGDWLARHAPDLLSAGTKTPWLSVEQT